MNRITVLGVAFDNIPLEAIIQRITDYLHRSQFHHLVTPNPEFLVAANRDTGFKNILNQADLSIADGVGIALAARIQGTILERLPGVDLMYQICQIAARESASVYLLGGPRGIATIAGEQLTQTIAGLRIVGTRDGGAVDSTGQGDSDPEIIAAIKRAQPAILFVAFGHGKQEKWIQRYRDQVPSVKIAMGVGGAFDYIAGAVPRANNLMRSLGLEWLYRLIKEPWRWKRIVDAVIVFPLLVLKEKLF